MHNPGRTPASRPRAAVRQTFERVRVRYFQVPRGTRRIAYGLLVVASLAAAIVLGSTAIFIYSLIFMVIFATSMRSPRGAATVLVLVGWGTTLPIFMMAYGSRSLAPGLLMLLGLVVAVAAHLIRWVTPWVTTLFALAAAGIMMAAAAGVMLLMTSDALREGGGIVVAVASAAAVLAYRFAQARSVRESPRSAELGPRQARQSPQPRTRPQPISVHQALAELDEMIGLAPVKEQVRSIAASIEAGRMRAKAGIGGERPLRHFVFLGPPGTGKTSVARTLAKIFYAFGLLEMPFVTEAQRADLVGEFLGATAIKTNELVDRALGGVLFIDEAYGLINVGDGQSDRFGNEAVQTLLKRAEDDRDRLVIILAGYEKEMTDFLAANPGLSSRFATRVRFPSYSPPELLRIAEHLLDQRGERLDPDARPALGRVFEDTERRGLVDELGNGRFVRTLVEAAAQARDVRVVLAGTTPRPDELVTTRADDVQSAFNQITERFRGTGDTPTVEEALADLDRLIGLAPVKRQIHAIAAQLRVARMRTAEGLPAAPPLRHFVFVGPPGTGKTTVARVLGRIFAALGLLARTDVVEAQRADLVAEHLGATALKTNRLVDSALGGVLFIDEAYALSNPGYSGGDAFGAEAVQTLVKRAEDERDRLVIVLAGYEQDMTRFLVTNPGLASRFATRVVFPSYAPGELRAIAAHMAAQAGDRFDPQALDDLEDVFTWVCRQNRIDPLGNGRFARTLMERAAQHRDVRLAALVEPPSPAQLTTITSEDVRAAAEDLAG